MQMAAALQLIYPPVCPVCRLGPPAAETPICAACRELINYIPGPVCAGCGGGLDTPYSQCRECQDNPRVWQRAAAALIFDGLARQCIHRFKYSGDTSLTPFLAAEAWRAWQRNCPDVRPDFLAPVPLHWLRRLLRGYNQAELICGELSRLSSLPIRPVLQRYRWTSPQASLSRTKRRENLRKAFRLRNGIKLEGKEILLVDDVMTTGSTLEECTRQLLRADAKAVHILIVARR